MSIASEISRITTDRDNIRTKLVDMSLATSTDDLDALTEAIQGISNQGAKTASLDASNTSYTIPQGYHNGGGRVSVSTQTKSATPSTSAQTISPDSGKLLSGVSVGAIQTETKTATPTTSSQDITPTSGKYLTKVTVGAIQTQTKSVTPSTSAQTVTPDSGKYLSSVSVGAISTQEKTVTASRSAQTVTPDSGKYLSKVTVNKYPDANGTYTYPANSTGGTYDMGTTNNLRYVNATNVYNKGKADGETVHTDTYIPAADTSANDMGASHKYRYVNTSGMIKPSGTKSVSYDTNGTSTVNVKDYENISITRNISASLSRTKLWENSNPNASFSAQTVTLSQSIANFQYIEIEWQNLYSTNTTQTHYEPSVITRLADFRDSINEENRPGIGMYYKHTSTPYCRVAHYVSDTQVYFTAVYIIGRAGSITTIIIPLRIYGLK